MSDTTTPQVLVCAAEPSGDLHAAHLIEEARKIEPELRFRGFGGAQMAAAGCDVLEDLTVHAAMGMGWVGNFRRYVDVLRQFDRLLAEERPRAVLLVDSPGLNFIVARLARWRRVPVIYYILPQIWAWATWRRGKILRLTDLLLAILPFEEELYRNPKTPVRFVGHPIADEMADWEAASGDLSAGEALRSSLGVDASTRLIGCFPGSREREIEALTDTFFRLLRKMELGEVPHRIAVSCFQENFRARIEQAARDARLEVDIVPGDARALMQAADFAVVASGTASLQLAYFETPMVVLYRTTPRKHRFFRELSVTPWLALPNIIGSSLFGDEATVLEALFSEDPTDELAPRARELLVDSEARKWTLEKLARIKETFFQPGGTETAARAVLEFIQRDVARGLPRLQKNRR